MRNARFSAMLVIAILTLPLQSVAEKIKGDAPLKDLQPFGTEDKDHKHQAYDLTFDAKGKSYTCRTSFKKATNAADFVVGASINYEIDDNKAKIKSPQNKKLECKIVRAELASATP
jgi:hypothetical protein